MPARHAVLLTPSVSLRPSQLPCYKQHEQTNFHSPYTLPSSVSCKSCVCHSYANTRGVGVFFPFWNLLVGCWRFDPGSQRLSRSSTDYCQPVTDLSTDLPRPCRGHCHPCLKSFSCNTYGLLASVANKRLTVSLSPLDATLTKNKGVGVSVMVNQKSNKNHCSERPSERGSTSPRPCRGHESKVTSPCVAAFPPGCYDLVFHDPC